MKRFVSGLCVIILLFSTCSGYVVVEKDIRKEEIISFNFTSEEDELLEYIDVSEYENVKIIDYGMNKGDAIINLEDDELILDLFEGKYSKGKEIREKIKTEDVESIVAKNGKGYFTPEENIKSIVGVDGDFENGAIKNGEIVFEISEDAKGETGYNEEKIVKSKISIETLEDNCENTIYSDWYTLELMPQNTEIRVKDIDINADAKIQIEDNKLRVLFRNGTPKVEETVRKDSHSYFWIDRALDGTFREEYPNSIYRTDRYYFEGRGTYIDDERLIMDIKFEDEWKDYVGFVLDNQKYVYLLNDEISKELFDDAIIMKDSSIDFEKYWLNTEELTVEITDDSVRYIPRGILYSMGELVAYSEGWGETVPNKAHESKESFYNNISERMETYVKHFKFFYGPKVKETFGGNVKYPYKAVIEYEHYEPATLYSGSVTYKYEEIEEVSGYLFDGWVKISYTEKQDVNDYPPTAPYNLLYNNTSKELTWAAGKDDYTDEDDIVYEIEAKIDEEFEKISETIGDTNLGYDNGKDLEFRVRAKDEHGQYSEWAYSNDSNIKIIGEISPLVVRPGDTVNISAIVKSLNEIEEVLAVSEELNINEELIKQSEKCPNATEISFNLLNYAGKEPWLIVDDMSYAKVNSDKEILIKSYWSDADTERSTIDIELPGNIAFTNNGTLILPNQNYTDIPIEIKLFNGDMWYFYSMCDLKFINKNTNKQESFVQFVNDTKASLIGRREKIEVTPYIKINLFEYVNGNPTYEKIPISSEIADKPISLTWTTKNNITSFNLYVEDENVYNYEIETNKLNENIKEFCIYSLAKTMDKMLRNSVGYQYHYNSKYYNWVNMYKSGNLLKMPFLGYKFESSKAFEIYEEYNNLTTTRDVNRLVFLDEALSENAIELYLSKIKSTNLLIERRNKETVFAKDIQELTYEFSKENIKIPDNATDGNYNVLIKAVDKFGNIGMAIVQLKVEKSKTPIITKEDINIGRFFHVDNNANKKAVEQLSLTKHNLGTEGFISAGETLAIIFDEDLEVDNIVIDFEGNSSIKEYDKLTETFLEKNPSKYGIVGDVKENYNFPVKLYKTEEGVFLYTIPYGTKQTLESWYTLREKSDDYEAIDKNLLFTRREEPYKLNIYINGNEEEKISFEFDVFERWDTILNRDASKYIINSGSKWRIEL
ncbi:MAG: hypothetical protein E7314_06095 [Clostridiales bacterium]|nr:hypothetical protein [Clostridiales bacterium]